MSRHWNGPRCVWSATIRPNVQANTARNLQLVGRGFLSLVKADDARAEQRHADSQLQKAQAELERALITTGARDDTNPEVRSAQLNRQFATLTAPTRGGRGLPWTCA